MISLKLENPSVVKSVSDAEQFAMVQSLGEITTWLPISGGLTVYATRYGDASLGVAMGWNYALSTTPVSFLY